MKFKQFAALPFRTREDDLEINAHYNQKKMPLVGTEGMADQANHSS
ncbi:MAG: hypothetical protein JF604_27715 [Bradyrhizobium sp.]|nr:hypothetical protein [Bradyrhizobium sp.]